MIRRVLIITRTITVAAVAAAVGYFLPIALPFPPRFHGSVLGASAVVFALAEIRFGGLISTLNAVLHRSSYSVRQLEELQQWVPKLRRRVWQLWTVSLILKTAVAVMAVVLALDGLSDIWRRSVVFAGYSYLVVSVMLTFWSWAQFHRFEKYVDRLNAHELELTEQKRLKAAMNSGDPVAFEKDKALLSYSGRAHKV